jgi:hypothetical protein
MTEFQRLIDDLEELKSTKLYENSFKVIDDCIHLLYSRKNYFESLEQLNSSKFKKGFLFTFQDWHLNPLQYIFVYGENEDEARELGSRQCRYHSQKHNEYAPKEDLKLVTFGL